MYSRISRLRRKISKLVVLPDANGRLGSCTSDDSVGDCGAEDENENGAALHSLFVREGLWLPATFAECVDIQLPGHSLTKLCLKGSYLVT